MRAVVKAKAGPGAEWLKVPTPEAGPGEILVRVLTSSICGTDYHIYRWDPWSAGRVVPPLIMGHEFVGEVVALGPEVHSLRVGDRVSAESHITCGNCLQCRSGQAHVCRRTKILGVDRDGCFAGYVTIPACNAWVNSPDLSLDIAAIQEPLGNAVHTCLAQSLTGRTVAVVGLGPLGLFAVGIARQSGAAGIAAVDISSFRRSLAEKMGAGIILDPEADPVEERIAEFTDGEGADVVLEMSGHPDAVRLALKIARRGGELSLLGLPPEALTVDWGNDIVLKGLHLKGITGRRVFETWYQLRGLLAAGLDVSPVITHRLPLAKFAEGMELMRTGHCGKVILTP